ncbi:MAG TPA: cysteine desulfuration protein SufE [Rhodospirillaceae bacterium]|nr:MAG: cysteine desufuration protein SufE [Alphaproteobacteria bacterium GWF2_58_20]HAU29537.1 cysteine desulfuration protein SufE [Rhodospirillaceae bacterium]
MTLEDLCENFTLLDNWDDRYRYLIELGGRLPLMSETLKNDTTRVSGCASQVFIAPLPPDRTGGMRFIADSDSQLVRGLIAILMIAFSGKTPSEIMAFDIQPFLIRMGLDEHISAGRKNGLISMLARIRLLAESAYT